ncbi:bacteriocin [Leuconostoc mesenteroides subsp. mesenteroides]|nr:bacteriocin [Leuconostoc carnosum]MBS0943226.1 leucocin A/sakacin P family class II bacteriocin [Leuconostoc mesenteroides]MBZ1510635.1 leucocin A/sakacin P family class II bacteriocin [Leuconostoc mesenteroides]MBZ1530142.1 leucocin A/sakacin P family class II bacteriocin [Leuconostoc mesenteroides]RDF88340.1 bacteriocin [Leuconostoc mesenteroides subsp. mesenteroides]
MEAYQQLDNQNLKKVVGGKYYGNGVHCTKSGCSVNWGEAASAGIHRLANGGNGFW